MKSATFVYLCLGLAVGFGQASSPQPAQLGAWAKPKIISWRVSTPRGVDAVGDGENDVVRMQSVSLSDNGNTLIYKYQDVTVDTGGDYFPVGHGYQFSVPLGEVTVAGSELDRSVSPVTVVHRVKLSCLNGERCISDDRGPHQIVVWLVFSSSQEASAAAGELRALRHAVPTPLSRPAIH